ncbi:MAG: hypothetical protein M1824_001503 [Vezdaea acicularis]|nr:MAG: hypothetical protein M1824_001503 [Vezdaea acicularis]
MAKKHKQINRPEVDLDAIDLGDMSKAEFIKFLEAAPLEEVDLLKRCIERPALATATPLEGQILPGTEGQASRRVSVTQRAQAAKPASMGGLVRAHATPKSKKRKAANHAASSPDSKLGGTTMTKATKRASADNGKAPPAKKVTGAEKKEGILRLEDMDPSRNTRDVKPESKDISIKRSKELAAMGRKRRMKEIKEERKNMAPQESLSDGVAVVIEARPTVDIPVKPEIESGSELEEVSMEDNVDEEVPMEKKGRKASKRSNASKAVRVADEAKIKVNKVKPSKRKSAAAKQMEKPERIRRKSFTNAVDLLTDLYSAVAPPFEEPDGRAATGNEDEPAILQQNSERPNAVATPTRTKRKRTTSLTKSPYFTPSPRKAGTSAIPFPPLSSPRFGLVQERLRHDPFRLLIAVSLLNRTKGIHAIPIYEELMATYPTPAALANAAEEDVTSIIRTLGLQNTRARRFIKFAKQWLANPPQEGKRYRLLHYPSHGTGSDIRRAEVLADETEDPREGAWEVAHLEGVGAYALDSWRIFCRDELRGVDASLPGVEGEWKRVRPLDKELRAYLKWRWMKEEGKVWDPETGERRGMTDQEWGLVLGGASLSVE